VSGANGRNSIDASMLMLSESRERPAAVCRQRGQGGAKTSQGDLILRISLRADCPRQKTFLWWAQLRIPGRTLGTCRARARVAPGACRRGEQVEKMGHTWPLAVSLRSAAMASGKKSAQTRNKTVAHI